MIITKQGYNLKGTVNFLNQSVAELIEKKDEKTKSLVDKNTLKYINNNLAIIRKKLDSSATNLNDLKINKKLFNIQGKDSELLTKIEDLEEKSRTR